MARRAPSALLPAALLAAALAVAAVCLSPCFVTPPGTAESAPLGTLRGSQEAPVQAAALAASLAALPDAAHAANQGYAVLQLGWAVFIIGLGPAVLFWIYFNKPEIL
uniref:Uncharacterized protein n=1 Tax=Zooxanthella nutricula TaxID=1333877 RepID=A0A7S2HEE2_9DINO